MASAFSATRWVLISSFGFRILSYFGQYLILRMVSKEAFGAYGSAVDFFIMALPLLPLGIDGLLIKEKARRTRYAVALAQALALVGAFLALLPIASVLIPAVGSESMAAAALGEGAGWQLALLMAPVYLVMATKLSVRSLLAAKLDFRTISLGEFGNGLLTWIGGAAVAWYYPRAEALLAAYLAGEIFECLWMYRGRRFRPLAVLAPRRWGILRRLYLRHRSFCLANTADLTLNNIGSAIPGPLLLALLSAAAAADYRVARLLIQTPIMLLVGSIWRVAYPALSGVTDDVLHSRCLRIIGTTAAFVAPAVLWLGWFAPALTTIVGGPAYATAVPLARWMTAYMVLVAIFSPISSLDMLRDKSEWGLYWNVVHTAARVVVIWFFAGQGVVAAVAAMCITSLLLWIVWAWMLGVLLGAGLGRFFGAVLRFVPWWGGLLLGFWACDILAPGPLWALAASALPGLAYGAAILRLYPAESEMVWRLAGRRPAA